MNKNQQEKLVDFLEELINEQRSTQTAKKCLEDNLFSAEECFKAVSKGLQHISIHAFTQEVKSYGLCTPEEAYLLFCRFDRSRVGRIDLSDFQWFFRRRSKQKDPKRHLTPQACVAGFRELLKTMLDAARVVRIAAKSLNGIATFRMFDELDVYRIGHISLGGLRDFMEKNDRPVNHKETRLLLKGIKQGGIYAYANLEVFSELVDPMELGFYEGYTAELSSLEAKEYTRRQNAQFALLERERAEKARSRSKENADNRRKEAGELVSQLEQDFIREEEHQNRQRLLREQRRRELEEQKGIRRQLLLQEEQLTRSRVENDIAYAELTNLREAEASEQHLNYLLKKEAELNHMELRQTRRRNQQFENELSQIKAETARKKLQLLRQYSFNSTSGYAFNPVPNLASTLSPSETLLSPGAYFQQPPPSLTSFCKTFASPKKSLGTTKSTWIDASSRSRIDAIEIELRRTELELQMRRNKIQLEQHLALERDELHWMKNRIGSRLPL